MLSTSHYDFALYDMLFEDDDHVGFLEQHTAEPREQFGYLVYLLCDHEARDPDCGFRH